MVEQYIYNYLISESTFTDLVDTDALGWASVSQDASYPKVVYKIIDRPRIVDASDEWQRWRFYITSDNKFEIRDIADVLTSLLNGAYGALDSGNFDFIQKLNESEITLRDDKIFQMYVDFRILYH